MSCYLIKIPSKQIKLQLRLLVSKFSITSTSWKLVGHNLISRSSWFKMYQICYLVRTLLKLVRKMTASSCVILQAQLVIQKVSKAPILVLFQRVWLHQTFFNSLIMTPWSLTCPLLMFLINACLQLFYLLGRKLVFTKEIQTNSWKIVLNYSLLYSPQYLVFTIKFIAGSRDNSMHFQAAKNGLWMQDCHQKITILNQVLRELTRVTTLSFLRRFQIYLEDMLE